MKWRFGISVSVILSGFRKKKHICLATGVYEQFVPVRSSERRCSIKKDILKANESRYIG